MRTRITICDLCIAEGAVVSADGTYTTDEDNTYDACQAHLEHCEGFGFKVRKFDREGDIQPGIL